jgi:hypothetical protein
VEGGGALGAEVDVVKDEIDVGVGMMCRGGAGAVILE